MIEAATGKRYWAGVITIYEEGLSTKNSLDRESRLEAALADFDSVLKRNPNSYEARHNKILTLYRAGRYEEALKEIEDYLRGDRDSLWAQRLRGFRERIVDSPASKDK